MNAKPETKEVRTGHLIAYSSLIIAILYAIHLFLILDDSVVKQLLINSKQKPSENAIGVIKNSFQFTGVMYVIANLTGGYCNLEQAYILVVVYVCSIRFTNSI